MSYNNNPRPRLPGRKRDIPGPERSMKIREIREEKLQPLRNKLLINWKLREVAHKDND